MLTIQQSLGFSLDDFTLAEAQQMFVEHEHSKWQHTAFISAYVIETVRDKKKGSPIKPSSLNPWSPDFKTTESQSIPLTRENIPQMKKLTGAKSPSIPKDKLR